MQTEELLTLVRRVQAQRCETRTLEVKAAREGSPTRLYDTLSGFSNQDEGGIILFGLDESQGFKVVGVYDPQDLQIKVTEQCKQMEPVVRPLFTVCHVDGQTVVSAEIPGMEITRRPVFYRGVGRIKGSYIRAGGTDELMSEYEVYSYESYRKRTRDDLRKVETARLSLFDADRLNQYLAAVKRDRPNLAGTITDKEVLELMGVTVDGVPTLAGLLVFSRYPQANFPQLCVTAVVVPGTRIGDTGGEGERFLANRRITGSVIDMLEESVDFVNRNGRIRTIIDDTGHRADKPEFPPKAVREAVLNTLVHRDLSLFTENIPIRLVMYSDRMEITNSGGLYGNSAIDSLGKIHPDTRNTTLANMLELMAVTENRYSGIPTMRREMEKAGLPAPEFRSHRGEFTVIFRNKFYDSILKEERGQVDIREALVAYTATPRTRSELTEFTGFSQYYTMAKLLQPLIRAGRIRLTIPERPRSRNQRYYSLKSGE